MTAPEQGDRRLVGRIRRDVARNYEDYDNERDSRGGTGTFEGDFTLNVGQHGNLRLVLPKSDGVCYFRPFPALDPADPEHRLLPCRKSMSPAGLTSWIVKVPAAKYIGLADGFRATFILHHPREKDKDSGNPYVVLFRACDKAKTKGQWGRGQRWKGKWNGLVSGGRTKAGGYGAQMSKPCSLGFVQGAVYCNGEIDYLKDLPRPLGFNDGDPTPVIQLTGVATTSLFKKLDKPRKGLETEDTVNISNNFAWNPIGRFDAATQTVKGGMILGVFRPDNKTVKPQISTWDGEVGQQQGYELELTRELTHNRVAYRPDLDVDATNHVFNRWTYWFDVHDKVAKRTLPGVLRLLSIEEQCAVIARCFKDVPGILRFGWYGHEEFFTPEVKSLIAAAVSFAGPGEYRDDEGDDDDDAADGRRPAGRRAADRDDEDEGGGGGAAEDEEADAGGG